MSILSFRGDKKNAMVSLCILCSLLLAACSPIVANATANTPDSPSAATAPLKSPGSAAQLPMEYLSPLPNARYVSQNDTIILRYGPVLSADEIANLKITVKGAQSGAHSGKTILADDRQTVIFKPDQPYAQGEQMHVHISNLKLSSGAAYQPLDYTFYVATNQQAGVVASTAIPTRVPQSAFPKDLTLPQDIPHFSLTVSSPATATEGYIFVAPFFWAASTVGSYLLILDNNGQVVYYQPMADQQSAFDFKELPSGYLTYYG